jgi:AraC-like DNA-binding protein
MKTPRLLVATSKYAPFILCGSLERHQRGPVVRVAEPWYRLWLLRAGEWELSEAGKTSLHVAPCAVLIKPGAKLKLTLHGRTDRQFLDFDVVHQRRAPRKRGQLSLKHVDSRLQPLPPEVWGLDVPAIVPKTLLDSCLHMMAFCCLHWWRDPIHHARANARLADWLAGYVLVQRASVAPPAVTWLEDCQRVARQHLETCLNVERWAALMSLGRQHFSARFTEEQGQTPQEYLAGLRQEQACRSSWWPATPGSAISKRFRVSSDSGRAAHRANGATSNA